jgi:hypothetical protein
VNHLLESQSVSDNGQPGGGREKSPEMDPGEVLRRHSSKEQKEGLEDSNLAYNLSSMITSNRHRNIFFECP